MYCVWISSTECVKVHKFMFTAVSEVHDRNTRSAANCDLYVPPGRHKEMYTLRKDFVILQLYWSLFSCTKHCSQNSLMHGNFTVIFPIMQDNNTYYDC